MNPDSSRLDRIERMIEAQAANLAAEGDRRAALQEEIDICFQLNRQTTETLNQVSDKLDRLTDRVDRMGERMDQMGERMDQMGERFDQMSQRFDQVGERLDQVGERLDQMGGRVDQVSADVAALTRRMDESARQAELDRAEFQSTFTALLEALNERFRTNGHGT
jgi:methyl-accepting chemotaxis protein